MMILPKPALHAPFFRLLAVAALLLAGLAPDRGAADDSDLCLTAAIDAARINSVPLSVLVAITQAETGRAVGGSVRPWPWTVNVEGTGHWFDDRESAIAFAEAQSRSGLRSFDIGCFQLNYRWHGEAFTTIAQMFDPLANASYAAGFLSDLHSESGDWSVAAGAYHSRTPEHASAYRARFDRFHSAAVAAGMDRDHRFVALSSGSAGSSGLAVVVRTNTFPLLRETDVEPSGLGSLVPLIDGG